MTRTCRSCCPACSPHFASLEAFDAHRIGDHRPSDRDAGRRCEGPAGLLDAAGACRFVVASTADECRMRGDVVSPVPLWALRKTPGQLPWLGTLPSVWPQGGSGFGRTAHASLSKVVEGVIAIPVDDDRTAVREVLRLERELVDQREMVQRGEAAVAAFDALPRRVRRTVVNMARLRETRRLHAKSLRQLEELEADVAEARRELQETELL